jgi:hypothetical protein
MYSIQTLAVASHRPTVSHRPFGTRKVMDSRGCVVAPTCSPERGLDATRPVTSSCPSVQQGAHVSSKAVSLATPPSRLGADGLCRIPLHDLRHRWTAGCKVAQSCVSVFRFYITAREDRPSGDALLPTLETRGHTHGYTTTALPRADLCGLQDGVQHRDIGLPRGRAIGQQEVGRCAWDLIELPEIPEHSSMRLLPETSCRQLTTSGRGYPVRYTIQPPTASFGPLPTPRDACVCESRPVPIGDARAWT